ncbi:MAG TPA: S8 family serine peptidase, partial [Dongiaceae bacterium]
MPVTVSADHGSDDHGGGDHGGSGGGGSGSGSGGSGSGSSGGSGDDGGSGDNSGSGSSSGDDSDDGGDSGRHGAHHHGEDGAPIDNEPIGHSHDRMVRSEIVIAGSDDGIISFARRHQFRVLGSQILGELGLNVLRLQAPDGTSAAEARGIIAAAFPEAIVDFNHLYRPQTSLTIPAPNFAARAVAWREALSQCGAHLRLGMVDAGVDWSAPVLSGAHGRSADFLDSGAEASSRQHGTAIASLIVGQQDFGLLPKADLYAAEIFGVDSDGAPLASATSFAAALNWLLASKVGVINVSLSGPPDRLMEIAVARAGAKGAHLVAAVGNDGTENMPRYPAAYPGVIGVTAVDARGAALPQANRGAFVALSAP